MIHKMSVIEIGESCEKCMYSHSDRWSFCALDFARGGEFAPLTPGPHCPGPGKYFLTRVEGESK